ncbi:MAG TPA: twin-arginine translocase TatA/TatE family subunit [Polyangiaceae bacterium]
MPVLAVGIWQLLIILLIVVLLFGTGRLSEVGKGIGEGIRNFKRGLAGDFDAEKPSPEATRPDDQKTSEKEPLQLPPKDPSHEASVHSSEKDRQA